MASSKSPFVNHPLNKPSHLLTEEEYVDRHLPGLKDHPLADAYLRLQHQWLWGKGDYAAVAKAFDEYDEATRKKDLQLPGRPDDGSKVQGDDLFGSASP